MKSKINFKMGSRMTWPNYSLAIKSLIVGALILTGIQASLQAQEVQYTRPSWWFGLAGGANFNYYRGSTQILNSDLTVPVAFHDGKGAGLYLAPLVEFHPPKTRWGFMLQAGYDNRKAKSETVTTPCNCPADLNTNLSYITVEPSLRVAPFKSNFYLYAGPRLAFNYEKEFTYKLGNNPDYPEQVDNPEVKGDYSNVDLTVISMQIGAGYDIPISSQTKKTQWVLSPFVSYHPYFGQSPRSIETWNVTTIRAGVALKLGRGHKVMPPVETPITTNTEVVEPNSKVKFTVNSPKNIPSERRVRETFPLRNYIFFDLGQTYEISDRYVLLTKDQVKNFKEEQLDVLIPKKLSGRSTRQMIVYYNILNILGDRMGKNPNTVVRLTGASMEGEKDGKEMAETVKRYLVDVFGIDGSRINTEGRLKPRTPSEQPGALRELDLLREGDRRVSIWSESPALMMEFQSGPDAPLKPMEISTVLQAPPGSYITFNTEGAKDEFSSWSLEITDDKGIIQYFGPYTQEIVSIPGKDILGSRAEGDYKVTMLGRMKSGKLVKKETTVHMVLWTPPKNEEGMRFSVIYEFNDSKSIATYEKYLTDVVVPKIPKGATVIISGYTDKIGDETYNRKLSLDRAFDVRNIIEKGLTNTGRTDVQIEVYGYGEDQNTAPFENNYPEERFYNRTVIIDIIPKE